MSLPIRRKLVFRLGLKPRPQVLHPRWPAVTCDCRQLVVKAGGQNTRWQGDHADTEDSDDGAQYFAQDCLE